MSRATRRLKAALLAEILAEDVPALPDDWQPPTNQEPEAVAAPTVTVTALGGRSVEVREKEFALLVTQAGVVGPDLNQADLGKLLETAKQTGPRHLLNALLCVRTPTSPLYRIRLGGRPWRPDNNNPTNPGNCP